MRVLWYIILIVISLFFSFISLVFIERKRLVSLVLFYAFGIIVGFVIKDFLEIKAPQGGFIELLAIGQGIPMTLVVFFDLDDSLLVDVAIGLQSTICIMVALFAIGLMPAEVYLEITENVVRLIAHAYGLLFVVPLILMIFGAGIWNSMNGD